MFFFYVNEGQLNERVLNSKWNLNYIYSVWVSDANCGFWITYFVPCLTCSSIEHFEQTGLRQSWQMIFDGLNNPNPWPQSLKFSHKYLEIAFKIRSKQKIQNRNSIFRFNIKEHSVIHALHMEMTTYLPTVMWSKIGSSLLNFLNAFDNFSDTFAFRFFNDL